MKVKHKLKLLNSQLHVQQNCLVIYLSIVGTIVELTFVSSLCPIVVFHTSPLFLKMPFDKPI